MCSISGAMFPLLMDPLQSARYEDMLRDVICVAEERGRDSWGCALISLVPSQTKIIRKIGRPSHTLREVEFYVPMMSMAINNNRAEPTTEYVSSKLPKDIQPFTCGGWIVAHNGTIANDKELIEKYGLKVETSIDSAVIPALLAHFFSDPAEINFHEIVEVLSRELVGSYALAIAHTNCPNDLILMVNYKPLYVACNSEKNFLLFSSLDKYLEAPGLDLQFASDLRVKPLKPYSALHVTRHTSGRLCFDEISLPRKRPDSQRALVVCSGGLDSTVVAADALRRGYEVTLLHFQYSARAEVKEVEAVRNIADRLGCDYLIVGTDIFKTVIGGSRLTNTRDEISEGVAGAEFAHEWVPARNLIMLAVATGIAESKGYGVIMLGNNLEESGAYPDNEMEFIRKFSEVLPYATQVDKHVRVEMPVGHLMKHEIVKKGVELGAPLDLTWSCYEAGDLHCGQCGPCFMRKTAFKINNIPEVIQFLNE